MYCGTELPACWRLDNFLLSCLLYAILLENIKSNLYLFIIFALVEDLLDFAYGWVIEGWELARESMGQSFLGLRKARNIKFDDSRGI